MKRLTCLLVISIFFISSHLVSQQSWEQVERDYGKLFHRYQDSLSQQTATYVFVIDVSTSMRPFESAVKSNIRAYIMSLPAGDKVTLIQKSSTSATNFIGIPNLTINPANVSFMVNNLMGTPFTATGSDGYRMMEKVTEAISQTGLDELLYIFFFTDFEYWTQQYGYDVEAPDWQGLRNNFSNRAMGHRIISYGLNLNNPNVNSNALYTDKLTDMLPGFSQLIIANQVTLQNWFDNVRSNTYRDRLQLLVENISKRELKTARYHAKVSNDGKLVCNLECPGGEILTSFEVPRAGNDEAYLRCSKSRPLIDWPNKKEHAVRGHIIAASGSFVSDKYNEVEKLLNHPIEYDGIILIQEKDGYVPWWIALIIVLVLLAIGVCMLLTCLEKKVFSSIRANADWTAGSKIEMASSTYSGISSLIIGNPGNDKGRASFQLAGVTKQAEIFIRRRCACRLWVKSGVYIRLNQGGRIKYKLAGSREERNLMTPGSTEFLCKTKNFMGVTVEFEDNAVNYSVKIR